MTPDARPPTAPATGSAWQTAWPGEPRPMNAGSLALVALPTSPFWARRYTRQFLGSCRWKERGNGRAGRIARVRTRNQRSSILR